MLPSSLYLLSNIYSLSELNRLFVKTSKIIPTWNFWTVVRIGVWFLLCFCFFIKFVSVMLLIQLLSVVFYISVIALIYMHFSALDCVPCRTCLSLSGNSSNVSLHSLPQANLPGSDRASFTEGSNWYEYVFFTWIS